MYSGSKTVSNLSAGQNMLLKRNLIQSDKSRKNCALSHAVADQPLLLRWTTPLASLTLYACTITNSYSTQEIPSPNRGAVQVSFIAMPIGIYKAGCHFFDHAGTNTG